jgi:hypothetical protein
VTNWQSLDEALDQAVDDQYGESVTFIPYKQVDRLAKSVPDTSRSTITGIGYMVSTMTTPANVAPGFASKRSQADLLLAVQAKYLTGIHEHDMVRLNDRDNQYCEIAYSEAEQLFGRQVLHLLRRNDMP